MKYRAENNFNWMSLIIKLLLSVSENIISSGNDVQHIAD